MKSIPESDHVARFCGRQKQIRDENGKIVGIQPHFFALRPEINERSLSCDWFEYFSGTFEQKLNGIRSAIKGRMNGGGKEARIAIISVGKFKDCGTKRSYKIRMENTKKSGPSYSAISGLPQDNSDLSLLEALKSETIVSLEHFVKK